MDRYLKSNLVKYNFQPDNVLLHTNKKTLSSNAISKSPNILEQVESQKLI